MAKIEMNDILKIAVISDIHGNKWALEKVLKDIKKRKIKTIFNLEDSLYGPLDPVGTFKLLSKNKIYNICGNEDRIIFENIKEKTNNLTLNYVSNEFNQEIIKWLKSLKKT
jgi:predicted phosphodiesterase